MTNDKANFTGPAQLEITRTLPAKRERVWEYLTDPDLRQKWFCAGETGSKAGEPFVMDFDHSRISNAAPPNCGCGDPVVMAGTILIFEPPQKLSYRWPGQVEEEDSIVTIELAEAGDQTQLTLIHSKLTNPEFQQGASAGWHTHLDLLVDLTEGKPARDFWVHYDQIKSQYESAAKA